MKFPTWYVHQTDHAWDFYLVKTPNFRIFKIGKRKNTKVCEGATNLSRAL